MISININMDGEITISQESPGERKLMSEVYASQEAKLGPSAETLRDEQAQAMFKNGFDAATREAMIQFVNGRLPEYFNELGMEKPDPQIMHGDPHHDEPEGTGEEQPVIRVASDSGEPEKESVDSGPEPGTWTMSSEELQAIKDGELQRGHEQGVKDARTLYFSAIRGAYDRAVASATEEIEEWRNQHLDDSTRVEPDGLSLVLRGLFRELGMEVRP